MTTFIRFIAASVIIVGLLGASLSWSADKTETSTSATASAAPEAPAPGSEKINVDTIREKYWARGNEAEMGVVQNRLYSKAKKIELGVYGAGMISDPFLNVTAAGISLGYHFNEYFAAHLLYLKAFPGPSAAMLTLQAAGKETNFNYPRWYWGGEGAASLLYGKLSVAGMSIIYYDMHLLAGMGITGTDSGNYLTPSLGIGQQFYLAQWASLRLDYRLMMFQEEIFEKVITQKLGQSLGYRTNWNNTITLGITFLIGTTPSDAGGKK